MFVLSQAYWVLRIIIYIAVTVFWRADKPTNGSQLNYTVAPIYGSLNTMFIPGCWSFLKFYLCEYIILGRILITEEIYLQYLKMKFKPLSYKRINLDQLVKFI